MFLEADAEDTDRYVRFLRYVYTTDRTLVNLQMVRRGHGEAVLYEPKDAHIVAMRAAEEQARREEVGIRGMPCDLDGDPRPDPSRSPADCHPAYTPCVSGPPPDLDCADLRGPIAVDHAQGDPHRLDGDGDGSACR